MHHKVGLSLFAYMLNKFLIIIRPQLPIWSGHADHLLDIGGYDSIASRCINLLLFCGCICWQAHYEPSLGANYCTHASRKKDEGVASVILKLCKRASIFGLLESLLYHSRNPSIPIYTRSSANAFTYCWTFASSKVSCTSIHNSCKPASNCRTLQVAGAALWNPSYLSVKPRRYVIPL